MNKVFLIGNLTRDPEMRSTQSGVSVCNFSIAVNRRFRNAQTGQQETDFLNIVAWRQLAELCGRYLTKGSKVAVTRVPSRPAPTKRRTVASAARLISSPTRSSSFPLPIGLTAPLPAIITKPLPPPPPRRAHRLRPMPPQTPGSRRWDDDETALLNSEMNLLNRPCR